MTLSRRTILIVVSTFIALLFILAITSDIILLRSFAALERVVVADNVQKVRNEIEESYDELLASLNEYAGIISAQGNTSFGNLPAASLGNHHVDIAICFSHSKQVMASIVTGKTVDSGPLFTSLRELVTLVQKAPGEPLSGLILVENKPLQLVIKSLPGKDILVVGRYLDESEINRVTALTEFVLELLPVSEKSKTPEVAAVVAAISAADENFVKADDEDTISGYTLFNDFFERPALLAKITEERLLYQQGKVSIIYVLISLFVAGGVFCCVMLIFIRDTILSRLASLSERVSQITTRGDISERLPASRYQDELADLGMSINGMLDSLESAEMDMRDSEGRYRMLFERAPDAIIIVGLEGDEAGRIVAANQAAADQHGYTVAELLAMSIYELNTADSNKTAADLVARIVSGEWVTTELWHHKKDGTCFPLEIHAGLIVIGGKNYILGFDRDISQRKMTEETDQMYLEQIHQLNNELSRKALDLVAANNELETFNYSVSHDMRGPLTRISGYCQLLLDDSNLDPVARDYVGKIYESEMWLNDMVDSLLVLAQLSAVEIDSETVDLSAIAEAALKELSLENPDRSVTIRIEPDIVAAGDPKLLKMVMINLLNNAWKYSSRRSDAFIEFGIKQTESGPVYFVSDNGAGFDMKNADKLFRVFTRLHDSNQFAGTGIGLATVQRIISRHGGRIWAEAEPDAGATFFFTLS